MKLKECLELGKECGLTTWEDCYVNVDLHAMCIFKYDEINKEILELQTLMVKLHLVHRKWQTQLIKCCVCLIS